MKRWLPVTIFVTALASCAMNSGYVRYTIEPVHGTLRAHNPHDDLDLLQACEDLPGDKGRCIAMFRSEFYRMEKELLELRSGVCGATVSTEPSR